MQLRVSTAEHSHGDGVDVAEALEVAAQRHDLRVRPRRKRTFMFFFAMNITLMQFSWFFSSTGQSPARRPLLASLPSLTSCDRLVWSALQTHASHLLLEASESCPPCMRDISSCRIRLIDSWLIDCLL